MKTRPNPLALPTLLLMALATGSLAGCGLLRTPGRMASAALGPDGKQAPAVDPTDVQVRLMRFADLFALEITHASNEFAQLAGTPEGRIQALKWRLETTNAIWRLASGPRPFAALFDTIVVITALRAVHEERWLAQWGEADRPMLDSLVRLEQEVWSLAGEGLTEAQLSEVRTIVATWLAGDPTSRVTDVSRLPGFADLPGVRGESKGGLASELTGLLSVDPLSSLEPAVREVEQSRQLAERAFYYMQRTPELVSARVELLVLRSTRTPEVLETLASVQRVSEAVASLATTAAALPANFIAEREAALAQISAELTAQRAGLVRDLETAQQPVLEILEGTRKTAESSRAMGDSLAETLRVLDAFVGRFAGDDEQPGAAAASGAPGEESAQPGLSPTTGAPSEASTEPAGKPFDISEYGLAAERIGVAARELGATIETLDRSLPELQRVLDEAAARGERGVDHAFARALQLLAAALVGAALVTLLVRWISRRWLVTRASARAD